MCRVKIFFLSFFLFQAAHAMESHYCIPVDLMDPIIHYVISLSAEDIEENTSPWNLIKHTWPLQLISKDCKDFFWKCFTQQEKDSVINILLDSTYNKNCLVFDIAMSMKASIYPILKHAICEKYNQKRVQAILAIQDANLINKIDTITIEKNGYTNHLQMTPLQMAILHSRFDIVKLLLDCPLTHVNESVPLYTAIRHRKFRMTRRLLEHPRIEINTLNRHGETALFAFAGYEYYFHDITRQIRFISNALIEKGIDSTIKNNNGKTALEVIRYGTDNEVLRELEQILAMNNNI